MTVGVDVFGDFTIIKELGAKAFGLVYLAEHRFMKKQFVIKVIPKELSNDPEFIENFEQNIGVIAKLNHPAIIKIHNVSVTDGKYFLVMDPIIDIDQNTLNLEQYLNENHKLSERDVETILTQIASALDHAHKFPFNSGYLFHGSIKLTNILIQKNDKNLRVYLADFGVNRLIGEKIFFTEIAKNMADALTINNSYLFLKEESLQSYFSSFAFLAPEQKAIGNHTNWGAKVDTYSFGVLAYYLLTKRFPEGNFVMPSKIRDDLTYFWDEFILELLHQNPINRPLHLIECVNRYLTTEKNKTELAEVEKNIEDKMQLSFSFQQVEKFEKQQVKNSEEPKVYLKPILNPQQIDRPTYEPDPGAIFNREMQVSRYEPKKIEIKEVEPILTDMVVIPGDNYSRGCVNGARDEMPRHVVTVDSFAIDIHPITNEQFVRLLQAMGGEKDVNNNDIIRLRDSRIKRIGGKLNIESGYAKHPVVGVTWYGAVAYAKWVGKRLPTEAEWEIFASSGKDTIYPTGESIERSQANFFSSDTTTVMSYPPNDFGIYDVVGNVYEWCYDWYAYNYYDISLLEPENPTGPKQGVYRVLRGGCWKSLKEDLRVSHRHRNNPGAVNGTYGFRCATDVSK
jgi:formylglycine-generating enzyme required for sulfatase activity